MSFRFGEAVAAAGHLRRGAINVLRVRSKAVIGVGAVPHLRQHHKMRAVAGCLLRQTNMGIIYPGTFVYT